MESVDKIINYNFKKTYQEWLLSSLSAEEKNRQVFRKEYNTFCLMFALIIMAEQYIRLNENDYQLKQTLEEISKRNIITDKKAKEYLYICLCSTIQTLSNGIVLDEDELLNYNFKELIIIKNQGIENKEQKNSKELEIDNKSIISNIRNGLAHDQFFVETIHDKKYIHVKNKNYFECLLEFDEFCDLWMRLYDNNNTNKIIIAMKKYKKTNDINEFINDKILIDKLLLNLIFNNNKENFLDKLEKNEYFTIDTSCFETKWYEALDIKILNKYMKNFKVHFQDEESKSKIYEEYRGKLAEGAPHKPFEYVFDINSTSYDSVNSIHMPNPIFLDKLRNAIAHGNYEYDKQTDSFIFKDIYKGSFNFETRIKRDKLEQFLTNKVFFNMLPKLEEEIKTDNRWNLNSTQSTIMEESFFSYMKTMQEAGLPFKGVESNDELILNNLIINNQISSYLFLHPQFISEFLEYKIDNDTNILESIINNEKTKSAIKTNMKLFKRPLLCMSKKDLYPILEKIVIDKNIDVDTLSNEKLTESLKLINAYLSLDDQTIIKILNGDNEKTVEGKEYKTYREKVKPYYDNISYTSDGYIAKLLERKNGDVFEFTEIDLLNILLLANDRNDIIKKVTENLDSILDESKGIEEVNREYTK